MAIIPPKPYMDSHHVAYITDLLLAKGSTTVLEYGAGGSTLYWPRLLLSRGRDFHWTAVAHVEAVANDVQGALTEEVAAHVNIHYVDCGAQDQHLGRDHCMGEYVSVINTLTRQPDVVLVDGRKRVRCVRAARKMLEGTGAVIMLHDAQREYYSGAWEGIEDMDYVDRHPGRLGELWVVEA
jgi:hypothetical protein